jgi:hypothetical protein
MPPDNNLPPDGMAELLEEFEDSFEGRFADSAEGILTLYQGEGDDSETAAEEIEDAVSADEASAV